MAELLPEDPKKIGWYWVRNKKRSWEVAYWRGVNQWYPEWRFASTTYRNPENAALDGYHDPRYIPQPNERADQPTAPSTPTLDDRQVPEWTLKRPGVLIHKSGHYEIEWCRDVDEFSVSGSGPAEGFWGAFPTSEAAKTSAEQNARWRKEFGL